MLVKLDHFPKDRVENKKSLKPPPPRFRYFSNFSELWKLPLKTHGILRAELMDFYHLNVISFFGLPSLKLTMMVNNPLIRPYFLGGLGLGGVPLDSH